MPRMSTQTFGGGNLSWIGEGAPHIADARTEILDVSAFTAPLGAPGKIRAAVTCQVPVGDLLLPGLSGGVSLSAESFSTLDRYRGKR